MRPKFEGWYYKQQGSGQTLALIPGRSKNHAFIQVITDNRSYNIPFDIGDYKKGKILEIGNNKFSNSGIILNTNYKDISLFGKLSFANLTPIKSDIMGPFRFFPMECRHGIVSMKHDVKGEITLNGEKINFDNSLGYIESDSGQSFPQGYTWIQSNDFNENCSIMASIAKIPMAGFYFWGCICVVWLNGREYRIATYNGAKIIRCEKGLIALRQGDYHLFITVDQHKAHNLAAPKQGSMTRTIKESVSCPAKFLFTKGLNTIFSGESKCASYEYVMK